MRSSSSGGFTYVAVMIMVALMGLATAASLQIGAALQRRSAEDQLLAIGAEFRSALISYANASPPGTPTAPASLSDLLRDARYPNIRRHLRKIYIDPLTGKAEWGLSQTPDGKGIAAVYSLAPGKPVKQANFGTDEGSFEHAASYRDWQFAPPPSPQQRDGTAQLDTAGHPRILMQ